MCGIAGLFNRNNSQDVSEMDLRRMLGTLRHRGPDEFGILLGRGIGLGSARLRIIDLEGGGQPIANEDKTLWIVFNGEIFNYLELRTELEGLGHRFKTASDTEVVLHLFEELGPGCLNQLNGQFAIAIWDTCHRRLFLARDRLGVCPLFYTNTQDQTIIFGSEIKSILSTRRVCAELDPGIIGQIFSFWSPLAHKTVFRGIFELPPGRFLMADQDTVTVKPYWQHRFVDKENNRVSSHQEKLILEEFRDLLIDSCRIRLRADVAVGAYLSGGLDSSTITAIIRHHHRNPLVTFSIAFSDPQFDESKYQQEMAMHLGTDHRVIQVTHEDIGRVFPEVIWHTETPLMRTAPAPMFLLSKLVRENGFKVVLTGEGADEFLAGYDLFREAKIRRFWAQQPQSKTRPLLFKKIYPDVAGFSESNPEFLSAFFSDELENVNSPFYSHAVRWRNNRRNLRFFNDDLLKSDEFQRATQSMPELPANFGRWDSLAQAQHLESTLFLSQYLLSSQGDRMEMANSVEGRYPFLDFRLIEFCNQLPHWMKLRCLHEKWILKKTAQQWLPEGIVRRHKQAYRSPIHRSFFNKSSPVYVRELLSEKHTEETGLFKQNAIQQLVKKIDSGMRISETEEMALVGILSTQLVNRIFIKNFRADAPISNSDRLKVFRLNQPDDLKHPFVPHNKKLDLAKELI